MLDQHRVNLLNFDLAGMSDWLASLGEPRFRARQVIQWIHQHQVIDIDAMTNLSLSLRERIKAQAHLLAPEIASEQNASDGCIKWLMRTTDGMAVETVYIPERTRATLCISSQVGCALNCSFCATGKAGFNRNLSTAEIIGQLWQANARLKALGKPTITNVVMMGMGEPLLNYDALIPALRLMLDDYAYGLSKYRVTVSTSGVLPMMQRLKDDVPVALAISLHAADDSLRNILVPLNKKYPLDQLIPAAAHYFNGQSRRVVTFEYVMIDGVTDGRDNARALIALLKNVPCKMNLIPFNPFAGTDYQCSSADEIERFRLELTQAGIQSFTRKTRGDQVAGACGQLAGAFKDRTGRAQRLQRKASETIS